MSLRWLPCNRVP
jgi:hypothetical protein